jgi:hypothetical protein
MQGKRAPLDLVSVTPPVEQFKPDQAAFLRTDAASLAAFIRAPSLKRASLLHRDCNRSPSLIQSAQQNLDDEARHTLSAHA